jgi:hypothetical protein
MKQQWEKQSTNEKFEIRPDPESQSYEYAALVRSIQKSEGGGHLSALVRECLSQ